MKKNPDSFERKQILLLSKKIIRTMKMTIVLMILTICQIWAVESYSKSAKIPLKLEVDKISGALKEIEYQAECYSPNLIDVERVIDIEARNVKVDELLTQLFDDDVLKVDCNRQINFTNIEQPLVDGLSAVTMLGHIQQKKIEGIVVDERGNPLPGVTIVVKGTTKGVLTDEEGRYSLMVTPEDEILVYSFIGMRSKEVLIQTGEFAEVKLIETSVNLDDIIVVGYMTQKKADLTGSVAIVSREDIVQSKSANIFKSLQGKIPGVYVQTNGSPVEKVNFQIRGITSVNSSPVLLVVDGLPTTLNMNSIDANDIESIQVLKDAASASIYGSRAASGVVLITTKQGTAGKLRLSYDGAYGVSAYLNPPKMLSLQEYAKVMWQAAVNDGVDPNTSIQIFDYEWHYEGNTPVLDKAIPVEWLNFQHTQKSAETDWFKEGTRLGFQQKHNLSINASSDKSRHLFSIGYYENQGTQIYTYFKRYSVRLNSTFDLLNNRLKIGETLNLSYIKYRDDNQMYQITVMPPIVPVHDIYGGWGGSAMDLGMDAFLNPIRHLTQNKGNAVNNFVGFGNVFAELKILKNLRFKTQFGIDLSSDYRRHILFTFEEAGGMCYLLNGVTNSQDYAISWTFTNTLLYNYSTEIHSLDVLVGMEANKYTQDNFSAFRDGIEKEVYDYAYLNAASGGQITINGIGNKNSLLSYFAKMNYSLKSKYLFSVTARYDGSSKFPEENKFGFFPSLSAGWRLSQEEFLKSIPYLSHLQARVSWGINGNQNIPSNAITTSYVANYQGTSYDIKGIGSGNLPSGYLVSWRGNPNLKWEATQQMDVGLDFGFLENRLSGSLDYFNKRTYGMLFSPEYLGAIGEGGYSWINAANMTNKGFEAILTYASNPTKNLTFNISSNFSTYRNKIDDLPESVKFQYGGNGLDDHILGRPLNSYYGFVVEGIFQNQSEVDEAPQQPGKAVGRLKYSDLNQDGRITWEHDRTWIGVRDPKLTYGLNLRLDYRNFDLSLFLQGIAGSDIYNSGKIFSDWYVIGIFPGQNKTERILNAWTPTNTNTDVPALSLTNANAEDRMSTHFIESGDYIKLRNLEVGYSFPTTTLRKLGAERLRIYCTMQNLFTVAKRWGNKPFTGVDPENVQTDYQQPRVFLFGINSTF